MGVAFLPQ
jgi:hypothetical protein